jgi:hypothetical protein
MANKYLIFRRNDGYINCSLNTLPHDWVTGGADPEYPGGPREGAGIPVTFEKLGEFDTFLEAYTFGMACLKIGRLKIAQDNPPIPTSQFDWSAIDDKTYDGPGSKIGRGPTPQAAITDLLEQMELLP